MRASSFGKTLLFGAAVALSYGPLMVMLTPLVGTRAAFILYLFGAVATYVAGLAGPWARGIRLAAGVLAIGGLTWLLAPSKAVMLIAAAATLALFRSGFAFRQKPARAVAVELVLGAAGLYLGSLLITSSVFHTGLAVWAYFVVQSLYFLIGGEGPALRSPEKKGDAFEVAHRRAMHLMDELA